MLLAAGHIFGSAQFFLFTQGETLLYTGDFKLRPSKSAEPAEWRQADTLIMETTFGLPRYRFPPTEHVIDQVVAFCRETIEGRGKSLCCSVTFVRESAGNSLLARRSRTHTHVARVRLPDDPYLRATRPIILQIRPLQCEGR
jgi:predicted metal-dependent RNase